MKYHWDKKYLYWGVTAISVISISILVFYGVFHIEEIKHTINRWIIVLMPIIYGLVIAYMLSPVVNYLENRVFKPFFYEKCRVEKNKKSRKRIRALAIFITITFAILFLFGFFYLLIPQLFVSISNLITSFPQIYENFINSVEEIFMNNPNLESDVIGYLDTASEYIEKFLNTQILPQINQIFIQLSSGVLSFIGVIKNLFIGIIVSIYVMSSKELFAAQAKKFVYAILKPYRANILIKNVRLTNDMFSGFISGTLLDSCIIGFLCFIATNLMNMPFAILISVIIGVTNVIPFFGPYIGGIPSAILILLVDPIKCVYFVIFIMLMQTIDGNILAPKILGHSTGLSSFWVIVAILIGGGIFGILGMFIGVPIFAVIYALIKAFINRTLIAHNLPFRTSDYFHLNYIDEDTFDKVYGNEEEEEDSKLHTKMEEMKAKRKIKEKEKNKSDK